MGEPTFHIVGPASSLEFAQMEYLGEMLMRNLPNIMCRIVRVHPSDWRAYASEVCRLQGFPPELAQRLAPFAWTGAGYLVGGAADFNADCRRKYNVGFDGAYTSETWTSITNENADEAHKLKALETAREKGERAPRALPKPGAGAALGQVAIDELFDGAWRLAHGAPKSWADEPLGTLDAPRVAVLMPADASFVAHKLFDVPESLLFLIAAPASAPTVDALEGIAYALTELRVSALLVLGATQSPQLDTAIAIAHAKMTGAPYALLPSEAIWAEPMSAAASNVLSSAPPSASAAALRTACAEEWLRAVERRLTTGLEVTMALYRARELHIACALVDNDAPGRRSVRRV